MYTKTLHICCPMLLCFLLLCSKETYAQQKTVASVGEIFALQGKASLQREQPVEPVSHKGSRVGNRSPFSRKGAIQKPQTKSLIKRKTVACVAYMTLCAEDKLTIDTGSEVHLLLRETGKTYLLSTPQTVLVKKDSILGSDGKPLPAKGQLTPQAHSMVQPQPLASTILGVRLKISGRNGGDIEPVGGVRSTPVTLRWPQSNPPPKVKEILLSTQEGTPLNIPPAKEDAKEYVLPDTLEFGKTYLWSVQAGRNQYTAAFRILTPQERTTLEAVETELRQLRDQPGMERLSELLLARTYARYGLWIEAKQQYRTLRNSLPKEESKADLDAEMAEVVRLLWVWRLQVQEERP